MFVVTWQYLFPWTPCKRPLWEGNQRFVCFLNNKSKQYPLPNYLPLVIESLVVLYILHWTDIYVAIIIYFIIERRHWWLVLYCDSTYWQDFSTMFLKIQRTKNVSLMFMEISWYFSFLNVYLVTRVSSAFVCHNQWVSLSLLYPCSGNSIFDYEKKI